MLTTLYRMNWMGKVFKYWQPVEAVSVIQVEMFVGWDRNSSVENEKG